MNSLSNEQSQKLFSICRKSFEEKTFIQDDSRRVGKGDMFIAIKGIQEDGHQFIPEAIQKGASTLVVENKDNISNNFKGDAFVVSNTKQFQSTLLNHYYDFPSKKMFCVGITGTNGKTTISCLLEKIYFDLGWKVGVMGTIDQHIGDKKWESKLTTPRATEIHQRLFDFYKEGAKGAIMEVSSIGIDQYRVDQVYFHIGIFTNLMRDHLDYHKNFKNYYQAKKNFFERAPFFSSHFSAILNADDEYAYECHKTLRCPYFTYGIKGRDIQYSILKESLEGIEFLVKYQEKEYEAFLPMIGNHNASNACAALLAVVLSGFSIEKAISSLRSFKGVKGRLQRIVTKDSSLIFVDYAHTPDALWSCLQSLNHLKKKNKKIITVFGCGGERDQGKRKLMGKVASQYSDKVIVTSDNPRNENPNKIIEDILEGVSSKVSCFSILDRKQAIKKSLEMAESEDIILVAGRGHEPYQIIKNQRIPFNDAEVIRNLSKIE